MRIKTVTLALVTLVAGALPFDSETLRSVGPIEAQRMIRDTDPPTPLAPRPPESATARPRRALE